MICRLKDRMLVSRNHQHRSLIGGVHGKDGIVHTRKRSRLLNRFLDTRLGPERHAFSAALVHLADFVMVSLHGYLLSIGDNVRSEERRVGKEVVSTGRSRWSP